MSVQSVPTEVDSAVQTAFPVQVADRKPDRPAERPMVPDKPKTRYTMPKGLDEETFGAEFKQRKTGKITRKQRRSESRGERK